MAAALDHLDPDVDRTNVYRDIYLNNVYLDLVDRTSTEINPDVVVHDRTNVSKSYPDLVAAAVVVVVVVQDHPNDETTVEVNANEVVDYAMIYHHDLALYPFHDPSHGLLDLALCLFPVHDPYLSLGLYLDRGHLSVPLEKENAVHHHLHHVNHNVDYSAWVVNAAVHSDIDSTVTVVVVVNESDSVAAFVVYDYLAEVAVGY